MNIRKEIQAIRDMNRDRKQALAAFLLSLGFWWGVGLFVKESPYKILSIIPGLLAILNIARVAPAPVGKREGEGQE